MHQAELARINADPSQLETVIASGQEQAAAIANDTMRQVRRLTGLA